jgi:hypothetical protein
VDKAARSILAEACAVPAAKHTRGRPPLGLGGKASRCVVRDPRHRSGNIGPNPEPMLHSRFAETLCPKKSCDGAMGWFACNVPNRQESAAFCGCAQQILQQPDLSERFLNALIKRACVRRPRAKTAKSAQHGPYGRERALFESFPRGGASTLHPPPLLSFLLPVRLTHFLLLLDPFGRPAPIVVQKRKHRRPAGLADGLVRARVRGEWRFNGRPNVSKHKTRMRDREPIPNPTAARCGQFTRRRAETAGGIFVSSG